MSRFGMRERDGVLETLLFYDRRRISDVGGGFVKTDWHTLNLKTGEIYETLKLMPPEARYGTSVVAWHNQLYVLGGSDSRESGKIIYSNEDYDYVFCFDYENPDRGWIRAPPMLVPRFGTAAVAAKGKIYAFGGGGSDLEDFAEVIDVSGNRRAFLSPPSDPKINPAYVSYPVHFDSPRSRILVHFGAPDTPLSGPLYAYDIDGESWEYLDENFGTWPESAVLVDGLLYYLDPTLDDTCCHRLSDQRCALEAYDVVDNKWLPVKWLSNSLMVYDRSDLFHLGEDQFCIAWYSTHCGVFQYVKFSLHKNSGEIHATGLSQSVITVPYKKGSRCDLFSFK